MILAMALQYVYKDTVVTQCTSVFLFETEVSSHSLSHLLITNPVYSMHYLLFCVVATCSVRATLQRSFPSLVYA